MPAEWEPHQATWLNWPNFSGISFSEHQDHDHLEAVYREIVRALIPGEEVWINTNSPAMTERVAGFFGDDELRRLRFFEIPTKEPWLQDFGGSFVVPPTGDLPLGVVDWQFNAWGGRYLPAEPENGVPARMADACGFTLFESDFVIEGGSFEVNGAGLFLTTESCVLNPNRNPHVSRGETEKILTKYLGVEEFIWLPEGLAWDDLDGHIDAVARFAGENLVVAATEIDPGDDNFASLDLNRRILSEWRGAGGKSIEVVELPMPAPISEFDRGLQIQCRLPASYANFYTGNEIVLVPSFDDPNDSVAVNLLQGVYPDRKAVSVDCSQIIRDFGALHCMLLSVPADQES